MRYLCPLLKTDTNSYTKSATFLNLKLIISIVVHLVGNCDSKQQFIDEKYFL